MKIIVIVISLLLFTSCNESSDKSNSSYKSNVDKWYVGGNLHKSKIAEWKDATDKNKLATCGDFIAKIVDKNSSLSVIKRKAENLKICIDEASIDENQNKKTIAEMASLCAVTLGY